MNELGMIVFLCILGVVAVRLRIEDRRDARKRSHVERFKARLDPSRW